MATSDDPGILSQYGLDLSQDDIRKAALIRAQQMSQVQSQGLGPMGYTGAMLANGLMANRQKPTDDQMARIRTAQAAQAGMEKWSNDNPDADAYTKQAQYKKLLATAAFQNGLPDVGSSILQKLDTDNLARQKQTTELKKLGIETEVADRTKEFDVSKAAIDAGKAAHVEAYMLGSRDPNATISGIYNPADGSLRTANGVIPAGMWKTTRPEYDPRDKAGGANGKAAKVGVSEQEKLRASALATSDLIDKTLDVDKLFNEVYAKGGNVAGMMDVSGKTSSFIDRWINTAQDLSKGLSGTGDLGQMSVTQTGGWKDKTYNLDSAQERKKYADDNVDRIKQYLPPNLAGDADAANRYASMIVDLAYATARSAEPGAKALTDADFNHAMQTIGGHLNDPTTLRKILFSRAQNAARSLDHRFSLYDENELRSYVGDRWTDNYKKSLGELDAAMGFDRTTGDTSGTSYPKGARQGNPARQTPDKDGWVIVNGMKVREKPAQ